MEANNEPGQQPASPGMPCIDCSDLRGKSFWIGPHQGQVAFRQDDGNIVYRCDLCLSTLTCLTDAPARKWGDWQPSPATSTGLH